MKKTLLFLSGGSQVTQFILQVLEGRRDSLRLLATSSISDDPGLWTFDRVFLTPVTAQEPEAFRARLLQILQMEPVDLIVPCRDDDIVALAELVEAHPEFGSRALCGGAALARMMSDKWLSFEFCARHRLPYADSMIPGSADAAAFAARVGYPIIAKPRDGFSTQGIFLIENEAQLQHALGRPNYVLQEFLSDTESYREFRRAVEEGGLPFHYIVQRIKHSIEIMIAPSGETTRVFATYNRQTFRTRYVTPNTEPATLALGRQCGEVFSRLGWRGPLNIQCQLDRRGRVTIHEFNGRFTAVSAERWFLGYDEVAHGIELFTGLKLPATAWETRPARSAVAQLQSRAADPARVDALQARGEWAPSGTA
jgi:carbamoyl-phosphate synthase large subunit